MPSTVSGAAGDREPPRYAAGGTLAPLPLRFATGTDVRGAVRVYEGRLYDYRF